MKASLMFPDILTRMSEITFLDINPSLRNELHANGSTGNTRRLVGVFSEKVQRTGLIYPCMESLTS